MDQARETGIAEDKIQAHAEHKTWEKRTEIQEGAALALGEIKSALRALDDVKPDEALAALKRAIGDLGILIACEPDLDLVPVDVDVIIQDVYTDIETIEKDRLEAMKLLVNGEVQKARELVAKMASEIVINVSNMPLASYYEAIETVVPKIAEGKIPEAKTALQAILNALVQTSHVIALPVERAATFLDRAKALAEKTERSNEKNLEIASLLDKARKQLRMAEALGYGKKTDYASYYQNLEEIKKKIAVGSGEKSFFDSLRQSLADLKRSLFD